MAAADRNDKQNQRNFRQAQFSAKKEKTDQEMADQYRQGAKMEGVSQSASLTGGTSLGQTPQQQNLGKNQQSGQTQANQQQQNKSGSQGGGYQPGQPRSNDNFQNQGGQKKGNEKSSTQPKNSKSESEDKKQQRIKDQATDLGGGKGGGMLNRIKGGYDKKIDKELDKGGKKPVAQRYREQKKNLNKNKKEDKKKKLARNQKGKGTELVTAPTRAGSGHLLKLSWINLLSSWGLTYFYIAFHFIMAYFVPGLSNLFCKFGHEWIPKQAQVGPAKEIAERGAKKLEIVEISGCFFIGIVLATIIGGIIFLFIILAYIYAHPLKSIQVFAGVAWDFIKCWVGDIFGGDDACGG